MAQYNDWSKSYQNSLGNPKLAAIRIAESMDNNDLSRMVDEVRNNHNDVVDSLGKFQQGISKINEDNDKYYPEVYENVKDVPPLKPKSASFAERYAGNELEEVRKNSSPCECRSNDPKCKSCKGTGIVMHTK